MDFAEKMIEGILVYTSITNNANISNAQEFKNLAFEKIENGQKKIIIDLSDVLLMDSTFLGALVVVHRKIKAIGGKLTLCVKNESISTLLGLTKLDKTFDSFFTLQEAIESF